MEYKLKKAYSTILLAGLPKYTLPEILALLFFSPKLLTGMFKKILKIFGQECYSSPWGLPEA